MQIWANSFCRSTFAFYEALARELQLPLRICLVSGGLGNRWHIGFNQNEFSHLEIIDVSGGYEIASKALRERPNSPQIFSVYQAVPHIMKTIREAINLNYKVGIASEAPCNMLSPSILRDVKKIYLNRK